MRFFDVQSDPGTSAVLRDESFVDGSEQLARRVIGDVEYSVGFGVGQGVGNVFDHDHAGGNDDGDNPKDVQPGQASAAASVLV